MNIEIPTRDIRLRAKRVRRLLAPLVDAPEELFILPSKVTAEDFVISVREKRFAGGGSFDNLRFRTVAPNFYAMYYERWKRTFKGKEERLYLYRAYLHLYHVDSVRGEIEFLLLHCDPNEPVTEAHAKYKRSIHMHIESAGASSWPHDIWPHSHIALNLAYLDTMLKNVNEITAALEVAVVMVKEQVLELLVKSMSSTKGLGGVAK